MPQAPATPSKNTSAPRDVPNAPEKKRRSSVVRGGLQSRQIVSDQTNEVRKNLFPNFEPALKGEGGRL
jgi:hypothetical protein